jgi:hypothetical protein
MELSIMHAWTSMETHALSPLRILKFQLFESETKPEMLGSEMSRLCGLPKATTFLIPPSHDRIPGQPAFQGCFSFL